MELESNPRIRSLIHLQKCLLVLYLAGICVLAFAFLLSSEAKRDILMPLFSLEKTALNFAILIASGAVLLLAAFPVSILIFAYTVFIGEFLLSFCISMLTTYSGTVLNFLFARFFFRKTLREVFTENKFGRTFEVFVGRKPVAATILFMLSVIPHYVKTFLLGTCSIKVYHYASAVFCSEVIQNALRVYIGLNIRSLYEVFNSGRRINKTELIIDISIIVVSILVSIIIARASYKIYKSIENTLNTQEEELNAVEIINSEH